MYAALCDLRSLGLLGTLVNKRGATLVFPHPVRSPVASVCGFIYVSRPANYLATLPTGCMARRQRLLLHGRASTQRKFGAAAGLSSFDRTIVKACTAMASHGDGARDRSPLRGRSRDLLDSSADHARQASSGPWPSSLAAALLRLFVTSAGRQNFALSDFANLLTEDLSPDE